MEFAFVGASCVIHGVSELNRFGQRVVLSVDSESEAASVRSMVLGGACLIPASKFDEIGFTEEELRLYHSPERRMQDRQGDAAKFAAFQGKYREALVALHEFREHLSAGVGFTVPAESEVE